MSNESSAAKGHQAIDGKETGIEQERAEDPPTTGGIDRRNEITGLKLLILQMGLCLCIFLVGLDFTLVATAVPTITIQFHSVNDVGWYGAAFYLALCATQPLAGKMFISFPKKVVYIAYVVVFEIGSLVCALAPSSNALIVGRAIAGLGGSGILAGGLIVVVTIVPLHKRAVWQGIITSAFTVASVVGPVLGGTLTGDVSWRWCFYINLPIGGFSAVVVLFFLNVHPAETERQPLSQKLKSLDGVGFILFAGAIFMILLALQWGGVTHPWSSSIIIGLFVGGGATLVVFAVHQVRREDRALIPSSLFTNRNFVLLFSSAFLSSSSFQAVIYWLPIWFQAVVGVSPTQSGVRFLAVVVADVITTFAGALVLKVLSYWNPLLLFGCASLSIGGGLLTSIYREIPAGHWIGCEILCGVGYSLSKTMNHIGVQASLPPKLVPLGSTALLFATSAGAAMWLSISQAIFQHILIRNLSVLPPDVVQRILKTGATQLRSMFDARELPAVIAAYNGAVTDVFYITTVAPIAALILVCGARWTTVKKRAKTEGRVEASS